MVRYSDLIIFFAIYSLLGWMLESSIASIYNKKLINRGFLKGYFCPLYGFGAIIVIRGFILINTIFTNYYKSLIINLLLSICLVTILEYVTGLLLMKFFNDRWWDYSNNIANLQGYICIKYSLYWGILAFVMLQVVHPIIVRIVNIMEGPIKNYITTFLFLYFIIDTINSVVDALYFKKEIMHYSKY